MVYGSMWMVGMRWVVRFIGLISTVILARVLTPEDFGVVAMAMIFAQLLISFSQFGVDLALIKDQKASEELYHSAWTIKVLQNGVIALVIVLCSPFIVDYFDEERLTTILYVISIGIFINGFENIGVVAFRKDLDFAKEFRFNVYKKLISFVVTISLAFVLKDYWALVIGIVTANVLAVILSYRMHPFRPKIYFKSIPQIWSFSQWMLIMGVSNFLNRKLDEFLVGGYKSTSSMGTYNVAADIALLPSNEIVMPISRSLFPGYAKLAHDRNRLISAFINVVSIVALVSVAASVGLMATSQEVIPILLGDQWLAAIPIVEWLALYGAILAFGSMFSNLLIAIGKIRWVALFSLSYFIMLVPILYYTVINYDIEQMAMNRALMFIGFGVGMLVMTSIVLEINIMRFVAILWRPVLAALAMKFAIDYVGLLLETNIYFTLIAKVCTGVGAYILSLLILWLLSGMPKGAEATLLGFVKSKLKSS